MKTNQLISEAIALPVEDRAMVAESILRSLNPPSSEIDKKWAALAKHRLHELRSGSVRAIPGKRVFASIWKRFAQ